MTAKKKNSCQQHTEKIPQKIRGTMAILEVRTFRKYIGSSKYEVNINTCSGFFIECDQIATNFHVLEGAMSVTAKHANTDRGLAKEVLGEKSAAKADFEKATQINGELAENYYKDGRGKNDGRAYEAAMDSFDKAIRLNPEYAPVYSNRAISQNDLGQRELRRKNPEKAKYHLQGAIADCTEAIRLNPKYTAAYNNRGLAKYRLGQSEADCGNSQEAEGYYHAAIADLDTAIQLNPKHVKAHRNRGYVKEKLGQQEAAEVDFERAKALDSAAQTA